ncbi:MAG: hypothetical protein M3P14_03800 [Chloroflexota bacterium]|nr:hypothetical protein [Chloroflexota bacterium]
MRSEAEAGTTVVVGSFLTRDAAEKAIGALRSSGYDRRQIGFMGPLGEGPTVLVEEHGTSAAPGAAGGLVTGAVAGGTLAWLGLPALPAIGPIVAGGALATALIGAGSGAVAGAVLGGLLGLGIPRHRAAFHEEQLRSGYCLVTVQTSETSVAEQVMTDAGATFVDAGEPPFAEAGRVAIPVRNLEAEAWPKPADLPPGAIDDPRAVPAGDPETFAGTGTADRGEALDTEQASREEVLTNR